MTCHTLTKGPRKTGIVPLLLSFFCLLLSGSGDWAGIARVHAQTIGQVDKSQANACLSTKSPSEVGRRKF